MRIAELIERLQKLDAKADVIVDSWSLNRHRLCITAIVQEPIIDKDTGQRWRIINVC